MAGVEKFHEVGRAVCAQVVDARQKTAIRQLKIRIIMSKCITVCNMPKAGLRIGLKWPDFPHLGIKILLFSGLY